MGFTTPPERIYLFFAETPFLGSVMASQCQAHGAETFRDRPYEVSSCFELTVLPQEGRSQESVLSKGFGP